MATAMALNISTFRTPRPIQSKRRRRLMVPVSAIPISNGQTREREKMKKLFKEARERCIRDPMDGVSFSVEEFHRALDECGFGSHIGSKVKGTILMTHDDGAFVDIMSESSAFLPLQEACIHKINHISEAGIYPGSQEEFVVIGENATDGSLILSLRLIQYDLAWERCQQLFEDDAVVKGKVVGENKGGVVVNVEGLHGFVPFSQIHKKSTAQELLDMELPLKFVMVDRKGAQLILSNCKAIVKTRVQMEIGSVVTGTVCSVKPYGVLVDIGGVTGLLHISQISHDHISDIAAVLQPGDILKVMILSRDYEKERVSLSTKRLEPTPGDMIHNPKLVFEKAEEMAETFKQRLTWVEEVASAEMLRSHPEVLEDMLEVADPRVEVPALLIIGEKDYCLKFPGIEDYIRSGMVKYSVPKLEEVIFIPEGTHFVHEQLPDQVNHLSVAFLNDHVSS